jgi:hypothetical protein
VSVIDPATGAERSLKDWDYNPDLFIFEKCIRGEATANDNIQSSYPRLQRTKILKALSDPFIFESIMNHTFTQLEETSDGSYAEVAYNTKELFDENTLLIDLRKQPDLVKKWMVQTILDAKQTVGRYNHMKFIKFCSNNNLENLLPKIEEFVPLLSCRH